MDSLFIRNKKKSESENVKFKINILLHYIIIHAVTGV